MATPPQEKAGEVVKALEKKGINASVIGGEFVKEPGVRVIVENGEERPLERPESDELWKVV